MRSLLIGLAVCFAMFAGPPAMADPPPYDYDFQNDQPVLVWECPPDLYEVVAVAPGMFWPDPAVGTVPVDDVVLETPIEVRRTTSGPGIGQWRRS